MGTSNPLRIKGEIVHFIPVGLEVERAALPLKDSGVDRVVLFYETEGDEKTEYFVEAIKDMIAELGILPKEKIEEEHYLRWDRLEDIVSAMVKKAREEQSAGNEVLINISSGGKLASIAGTITAYMLGLKAYYAVPEKYLNRVKKESTSGLKKTILLPEYKIEAAKDEHIYALELIRQAGRKSQRTLMDDLISAGALEDREYAGKTRDQARHVYFRRTILMPLINHGWIKYEDPERKTRRAGRMVITPKGESALEMFRKANRFIKPEEEK